jgi:capsular polysaccharide biosynthesis protein
MIFARVFISVFLLVFITSAVVTFILPDSYASTARVAVDGDTSGECSVIQSDAVLGTTIDKLNLNTAWGRKYNGRIPLKTQETMQLLRQRMSLKPERGTKLIDITLYSEDRNEAARIANSVAEAYQDYSRDSRKAAQAPVNPLAIVDQPNLLIDVAVPGQTPVRPNKPLNLFIGAVAGTLLGSIAGGIISGLASASGRKSVKA